jgi:hypothetical protein
MLNAAVAMASQKGHWNVDETITLMLAPMVRLAGKVIVEDPAKGTPMPSAACVAYIVTIKPAKYRITM